METLSSFVFTNLKPVTDHEVITRLTPTMMPGETLIGAYQNMTRCRESLARYAVFTSMRVVVEDAYTQDGSILMHTYFPYNQVQSVRTMHKPGKPNSKKKDVYAICLYFEWGKIQCNFDTTECLRVSEIQKAIDTILFGGDCYDSNKTLLHANT